jgi:SAM-dependent methyltransferase
MTDTFKDYWDNNIGLWADKYLDISHGRETFDRPAWFTAAYNATIGRLEHRLMKERYERTIAFINNFVFEGTTFTDLGCGTGIFVVAALKRGASVNAVDFSPSSLQATRRAVDSHMPNGSVNYLHMDLRAPTELPKSDVTLAMGVTPYLPDVRPMLSRAIASTDLLCCQYTDPKDWASRVRRAFPALDVRSLQCHDKGDVDKIYLENGATRLERNKFASGYIDVVASADCAISLELTHFQPRIGPLAI